MSGFRLLAMVMPLIPISHTTTRLSFNVDAFVTFHLGSKPLTCLSFLSTHIFFKFSGRGVIPHRRYIDLHTFMVGVDEPASARFFEVSRSGERPEPTVIVRMRENEKTSVIRLTGAIRFGFDPSYYALILVIF